MESMTGFGTNTIHRETFSLTTEARSVNHKTLSPSISLPEALSSCEDKVQTYLRKLFTRGRVKVIVRVDRTDSGKGELVLNEDVLSKYIDGALRLFKEPGVDSSLTAGELLALPGVAVVSSAPDIDLEQLEEAFDESIRICLKELKKSRRREGRVLLPVFTDGFAALKEETGPILEDQEVNVGERFARLSTRIEKLIGSADIDEGRMLQELAILADRLDVSEEVHRLLCHIDHAVETLEGDDLDMGRTLGFIIQEMHREVNTLGSKCDDPDLSRRVVRMKNVLASLKEQVANVQ